jgi:two-component system, sensor histidine kinase and response regulator
MTTRERIALEAPVGWKTVVGALVIVAVAITAAQVLLRGLFMDLEIIDGRIVSGIFHAIVVLVPLLLFLAWRSTAEKEVRVRNRLQASEALRQDLTHMLIHDLKTPVISAGIAIGALTHGRDGQAALGDEEREMLTIARESLARLESMIGDMLDIARAEAGALPLDLDLGDLGDIVRQAARHNSPQAADARVQLVVDTGSEALPVRADPEKIRRVLDNLLANAVKFTPPKGRIELRASAANNEAVVTVSDSGIGVPESLHERIFEKFGQAEAARQGRAMSVGLGLYFCKLVVDAHGGRIWVTSAPGNGSVFGFALPLIDTPVVRV